MVNRHSIDTFSFSYDCTDSILEPSLCDQVNFDLCLQMCTDDVVSNGALCVSCFSFEPCSSNNDKYINYIVVGTVELRLSEHLVSPPRSDVAEIFGYQNDSR